MLTGSCSLPTEKRNIWISYWRDLLLRYLVRVIICHSARWLLFTKFKIYSKWQFVTVSSRFMQWVLASMLDFSGESCLFIVAHYSHLVTLLLLMCVLIPCRMPFNFCTQCGTKLQPTFRFCPSCGEKLPCPGGEPAPVSLTASSALSSSGKDEAASALEKSPARATKRKSKYILALFCSDLPC